MDIYWTQLTTCNALQVYGKPSHTDDDLRARVTLARQEETSFTTAPWKAGTSNADYILQWYIFPDWKYRDWVRLVCRDKLPPQKLNTNSLIQSDICNISGNNYCVTWKQIHKMHNRIIYFCSYIKGCPYFIRPKSSTRSYSEIWRKRVAMVALSMYESRPVSDGDLYILGHLFRSGGKGATTLQKLGVRIGRSPNRGRFLRFEGEARIKGEARERAGEVSEEEARWAPPQKIFGISNFKSFDLVYSWKENLEKIDFSKKT